MNEMITVAGRRWLWLFVLALLAAQPAAALEEGQKFKDWTIGCEPQPGIETEHCFIYQTLIDKEDKPVLQMAVGYFSKNQKPAAVIAVPLGVALAPGMGIKVDGGELTSFPYERCVPQGCIAGFPLNAEMIGKFKRGNKAEIVFHNGRRVIPVPISLSGFTRGFDALDQ